MADVTIETGACEQHLCGWSASVHYEPQQVMYAKSRLQYLLVWHALICHRWEWVWHFGQDATDDLVKNLDKPDDEVMLQVMGARRN